MASAGYVFSQWSGSGSGNQNPLTITMDGDKTITANFSQAAFSCNNVTEIPRIECEALVALYNNTTGANWTNRSGWLVTTTPCSWFGVVCSNNHVTELTLDGNRLAGTTPPQLSNLTNLQILDLSINDLSGNIPVQLSSFTQLTKLILGENEFSGNIPSVLANLTNLIELHLDDNELTGSIPPELGRLTKLNQLWLSSNQLSGAIPPALGTLTNLTHVSLSHNQFSGAIPTEFTNLINLTTLFLQNNQFSGALPGTMPNLTKLGTFWFSDTNLCEPADTAFQSWLTRITSLRRTSVLCTPPPVDAAELVAQGDYTTVAPGELVSIWINVRNSGNTTWRASDGYGWRGTGVWSARSGAIWRDVPPNDVISFVEDIKAPSQPGEYIYGFILQHSGQDFGLHFFIKVTVISVPVVLVHGWNDFYGSWDTYRQKFLPSIGLTGYAIENMETGFGGSTPLSIDENAKRLAEYITWVKWKTGSKKVDIVAHSMGGLISRRYIAKYMKATSPDVNQLIMLGTPNAGSTTADLLELGSIPFDLASNLGIPRIFPSAKELTTASVEQFNRANPVPGNVRFYAIAGNYYCSNKQPRSNWIEPSPNDVVVWRESVFAIAEHGRWIYPSQQSAGCGGDHRGMRTDAVNDGGPFIFSLFVSPLLRGQMPATPPELQTFASQQIVSSQADQLQVVGNALDAIQFTNVQTNTLQPGGRLEFSRKPESGANTSFIVVGQPDQMIVSLRDPTGQVITSSTTDPNIKYMQMEAEFMPITSYTISNPVPGIWTTIIEASPQTPVAGVRVAALGSLVSDLRLTLPIVEGIPVIHQPISVVAQLQNGDTPLLGSRVSAQLVFPDDTATFITLLDDGLHGDSNAGDGIYGYQFTPRNPGVYSAIISAEGMNGNITFQRSAIWATQVDGNQAFLPMVFHK